MRPDLRAVDRGRIRATPLHASHVAVILIARALEAGLDASTAAKISGRPPRVGAAQDMTAAGIDLGAIMLAGG